MNKQTQVIAAIQRTEKAISFIDRELDFHTPNQFGKYPYPISKGAIQIASTVKNKYETILLRLNNILVPKRQGNCPERFLQALDKSHSSHYSF